MLLISRENFEDLKKRVNKRLSPFEKKVLNFYLDDYSYEDISKLTGKPKKINRQCDSEDSWQN